MNREPLKCEICGRFMCYADIDSGEAIYRMTVPESVYTYETFETICKRCVPEIYPNHQKVQP